MWVRKPFEKNLSEPGLPSTDHRACLLEQSVAGWQMCDSSVQTNSDPTGSKLMASAWVKGFAAEVLAANKDVSAHPHQEQNSRLYIPGQVTLYSASTPPFHQAARFWSVLYLL